MLLYERKEPLSNPGRQIDYYFDFCVIRDRSASGVVSMVSPKAPSYQRVQIQAREQRRAFMGVALKEL